MPEAIPIRAHHLKDAIERKRARITREQLANLLIKAKYLTNYNPNHPFVNEAYRTQQIMDDDVRIKIIAGEKDNICEKCPLPEQEKQQACFGEKSNRHYQDVIAAQRLGLELNKEYELKKLRKKWASTSQE